MANFQSQPSSQEETHTRATQPAATDRDVRRVDSPHLHAYSTSHIRASSAPLGHGDQSDTEPHHSEVRSSEPQPVAQTSSHAQSSASPQAAAPTTPRRDGKGATQVILPPINLRLPLTKRPAEAMRMAQEAFAQTGYWVAFFRAILGPEGAAARLFPTAEDQEYFASTPQYIEIHKMLTALRSTDHSKTEVVEPKRMITIRIPSSLQQALTAEASQRGVSINKLCISKLLMRADPNAVPTEKGRIRGRKPGQAR